MFEFLEELYAHSGEWGAPIVVSAIGLFVAGWVMMFTIRMVKLFILFTVIAIVLPNGIGVVGYVDELDDVQDAVVQRGEEITDEMEEAMEDLTVSPLYLGLLASLVTGALGVAGIVRSALRRPSAGSRAG